jgi:hypothetical protein
VLLKEVSYKILSLFSKQFMTIVRCIGTHTMAALLAPGVSPRASIRECLAEGTSHKEHRANENGNSRLPSHTTSHTVKSDENPNNGRLRSTETTPLKHTSLKATNNQ